AACAARRLIFWLFGFDAFDSNGSETSHVLVGTFHPGPNAIGPHFLRGGFVWIHEDQKAIGRWRAFDGVSLFVAASEQLGTARLEGVADFVDAARLITGLVFDGDLGYFVVRRCALREHAGGASAKHKAPN